MVTWIGLKWLKGTVFIFGFLNASGTSKNWEQCFDTGCRSRHLRGCGGVMARAQRGVSYNSRRQYAEQRP